MRPRAVTVESLPRRALLAIALGSGLSGALGCGDPPGAAAPGVAGRLDAGAPLDASSADAAPPAGAVDPGPTTEQPPVVSSPAPDPTDAGSAPCTPGEVRECQLDLLCTGVETCAPDGQSFDACACSSVSSALVGAPCASDADCAAGGHCMAPTANDYLGAGGPAGGYCTFPCADSSECTARDPDSLCSPVGPDGSSFCLLTCLSKEAAPNENKCLNRRDLACISVAAAGIEPFSAGRQLGFCAPRCGSDEDCPAGRQCHRQGGICTDFSAPGAPIGSACEVDTDCDGRACEDRTDGVGTCTATCVLGALSGCGFGQSPERRDAACVVPSVAAGGFAEGPGDQGFCLELCDEAADCQQADNGFSCRPLNAALAEFFGRAGACGR